MCVRACVRACVREIDRQIDREGEREIKSEGERGKRGQSTNLVLLIAFITAYLLAHGVHCWTDLKLWWNQDSNPEHGNYELDALPSGLSGKHCILVQMCRRNETVLKRCFVEPKLRFDYCYRHC